MDFDVIIISLRGSNLQNLNFLYYNNCPEISPFLFDSLSEALAPEIG
jgi:hypothetical protein